MNRDPSQTAAQQGDLFHEFLSPLTAVHSLSEILMDNPSIEAGKRQEFIGIILKETEKLIHLAHSKAAEAGFAGDS